MILVQKGILKALSSILNIKDAMMLQITLEGIKNILESGQTHFPQVRIIIQFDVNYRTAKKINSYWNLIVVEVLNKFRHLIIIPIIIFKIEH